MSVNVDLSFEIRDYDPKRREALLEATSRFLDDEGLLRPLDMIVDCVGQAEIICGYTSRAAILARPHLWIPAVTGRWQALVREVNGQPCTAVLEVGYPDEA